MAWHRDRRAAILAGPSGDAVRALATPTRWPVFVALAMPRFDLALAAWCGTGLSWWVIVLLAYGPGAWCAMARFAFLHETVHTTSLGKRKSTRHWLLRLGDMPALTVTNYLYYRWGHLEHHRRLGADSFDQLDESEEGIDLDLLFQVDTMNVVREAGAPPTPPSGWRRSPIVNAAQVSLRQAFNNVVDIAFLPVMVIIGGPFMRKRGAAFHRDTRLQSLWVLAQIAVIGWFLGYQALLYMLLAQLFFYFPLHPYYAFVSATHGARDADGGAQPTASIDAGRWFTVATFALNHHVEHHDFPNVPWHRLPKLRKLAPEFYPADRRKHGIFSTIVDALGTPLTYAAQGLPLEGDLRRPGR